MTSPVFLAPPRLATWLVDLFAPAEEESILGDLLEEFSRLASKSGAALARRWYWRQTLKTIAHLFGSGLRLAPWSTAAAVIGGLFLVKLVSGLPDKVLLAVTERYLSYWSNHFEAYMFWATDGMLIAHLIGSLFVGCIVALAAKGREMVATILLGLLLCALVGSSWVWVATHRHMNVAWMLMLWSCADPFAIVVGGAIVRTRRSPANPQPSGV
jgi:CDP-diglyceride synthetase